MKSKTRKFKSKDLKECIQKLILKFDTEGKKQTEIAKLLGISRQRVSYQLKKFKGFVPLTSKARSGRKRKVTDEIKNFILQNIEANRFISSTILIEKIKQTFDVIFSPSTVRRCIGELNFSARSPRKVPLINKKTGPEELNWLNIFYYCRYHFGKKLSGQMRPKLTYLIAMGGNGFGEKRVKHMMTGA